MIFLRSIILLLIVICTNQLSFTMQPCKTSWQPFEEFIFDETNDAFDWKNFIIQESSEEDQKLTVELFYQTKNVVESHQQTGSLNAPDNELSLCSFCGKHFSVISNRRHHERNKICQQNYSFCIVCKTTIKEKFKDKHIASQTHKNRLAKNPTRTVFLSINHMLQNKGWNKNQ